MEGREKRKVRVLFKAILSTLAKERVSSTPCPMFLFVQAMNLLLKENNERNDRVDYYECLQGFLNFLDEKKIKIDSRARMFVEKAIREHEREERRMLIRDAIKADFRHHKVLGDDY